MSGITIETSGSEGKAKRVDLSEDTMLASAYIGREQEELHSGDCWLNCLPQNRIGGVAIKYRCSEAGATMLLHHSFDPAKVKRDIERFSVTHISLVPVMLNRILKQYGRQSAPTSLRTVLIGGDRLPQELARRAVEKGWPLVVSYGMTESASRVTMLRLSAESINRWEESDVGEPLPGVEIAIGEQSEIEIRSEILFPMDSTKQSRVIFTGDSGWIDERGHLHIKGRLDDRIISGGVTIDPLSVEKQLLSVKGIVDVAIVGVPDIEWGELVVAVVVGDKTLHIDKVELSKIESAQRPRRVVSIEELSLRSLPRDSQGKLDRGLLRSYLSQMA